MSVFISFKAIACILLYRGPGAPFIDTDYIY